MRNLFQRSFLLVGALLLATTLLASDLSAEPAGAMGLSRRPVSISGRALSRHRSYASVRRIHRANRIRAARAARRALALAVPAGDVWARLRQCESGGRYATNTGNGFFGAYQFHPRT